MYTPGMYVSAYIHHMRLYGLSGVAGSGKDYIAKASFIPEGFVPLGLANSMKVEGVAMAGLPVEEVFGSTKSDTTRHWLQQRGTELGRDKYGDDIWCQHLELWMMYFLTHGVHKFVITDVRFPNEVDWVRACGGKVIRLTGRGGLVKSAAQHRSETSVSDDGDWDLVIPNNPEYGQQAVWLADRVAKGNWNFETGSAPV